MKDSGRKGKVRMMLAFPWQHFETQRHSVISDTSSLRLDTHTETFLISFLLCFSDHLYIHHCHATFCWSKWKQCIEKQVMAASAGHSIKPSETQWQHDKQKIWQILDVFFIHYLDKTANMAESCLKKPCQLLSSHCFVLPGDTTSTIITTTHHTCRQTTWTFCDLSLEKHKKGRPFN